MPMFHMNGASVPGTHHNEWVELTDDQVELARMVLDDSKGCMDPASAAIILLSKTFAFTLKHAVCAVVYAKQHQTETK